MEKYKWPCENRVAGWLAAENGKKREAKGIELTSRSCKLRGGQARGRGPVARQRRNGRKRHKNKREKKREREITLPSGGEERQGGNERQSSLTTIHEVAV